MKIMSEEELRAIDTEEFEGKDIVWENGPGLRYTGIAIFDYDQGLSILEKGNSDHCITGLHGPSYNHERSNYKKGRYHLWVTATIKQIRNGKYDVKKWYGDVNYGQGIAGSATCSFT